MTTRFIAPHTASSSAQNTSDVRVSGSPGCGCEVRVGEEPRTPR